MRSVHRLVCLCGVHSSQILFSSVDDISLVRHLSVAPT